MSRLPITKAQDLTHVSFGVPDIEKMAGFLADFGFSNLRRNESCLEAFGAGQTYPIHKSEHSAEPQFFGFGILVDADGLEALSVSEGVPIETRVGTAASRRASTASMFR